jgi:hypothetical protein
MEATEDRATIRLVPRSGTLVVSRVRASEPKEPDEVPFRMYLDNHYMLSRLPPFPSYFNSHNSTILVPILHFLLCSHILCAVSDYAIARCLVDLQYSKIQNLHIHQMPTMNIYLAGSIMASMPNLELLGILQCMNLGYFQTQDLLEAVKKANDKRASLDLRPVKLDFAPMFHQGPNSCVRFGSYGVFWNQPNFWTALPILAYLAPHIYPTASTLGLDLFSPGSSFRHFLDRLPLPTASVRKVLAACVWQARQPNLTPGHRSHAGRDFADQMTAAIYGDGVEPSLVPKSTLQQWAIDRHAKWRHLNFPDGREMLFGWWRKLSTCVGCQRRCQGWEFPRFNNLCAICMARNFLAGHDDHHLSDHLGRLLTANKQSCTDNHGMDADLALYVEPPVPVDDQTSWKIADTERARDAVIPFDKRTAVLGRQYRHVREGGKVHRARLVHHAHAPADRVVNDMQYAFIGRLVGQVNGIGSTSLDIPGYPPTQNRHRDSQALELLSKQWTDFCAAPHVSPFRSSLDRMRHELLEDLVPRRDLEAIQLSADVHEYMAKKNMAAAFGDSGEPVVADDGW